MSDLEKVKKLLTDRVKKFDDTLTKTAELVEIAPLLQKQKEEDETTLNLINAAPQDFAEENSPRWLRIEIENDKLLSSNLPALPYINPSSVRAIEASGSGTISQYVSAASNLVSSLGFDSTEWPKWANSITAIMDEYSTRVTQREYLPERLDKINRDLGKMFTVAIASYNKSKVGILGIDLCAIHLRDVLQQVWGGLTEMAGNKNKDGSRNTKDLQIKKEGDRDLVADILANEIFPKIKLVSLLSDIYSLHYSLSDTRFGKNPLNKDFPKLNGYYNQWLSLLDGISGIVV